MLCESVCVVIPFPPQQQQPVQGVQQQQQQLARVVWTGIMELIEVVSCIV